MDGVKMPRPDQRNLQDGCQNPIQLSENATFKMLGRTKLLD
jgi:hypothetical protein